MGETRDTAFGAARPEDEFSLYFRRHLPGRRKRRRAPVPDNITLLPLPPKSPELNPVENIWQFMRDNWLSNRVFESYDDILDHCCFAWNKLIDMPWKIISIGTREWAYRS